MEAVYGGRDMDAMVSVRYSIPVVKVWRTGDKLIWVVESIVQQGFGLILITSIRSPHRSNLPKSMVHVHHV